MEEEGRLRRIPPLSLAGSIMQKKLQGVNYSSGSHSTLAAFFFIAQMTNSGMQQQDPIIRNSSCTNYNLLLCLLCRDGEWAGRTSASAVQGAESQRWCVTCVKLRGLYHGKARAGPFRR